MKQQLFLIFLLALGLLVLATQAQVITSDFTVPAVQRTTSVPAQNSTDVVNRIATDTAGNLYQIGFLNLGNAVNMSAVDVQVNNATTSENGTTVFTSSVTANTDIGIPANASQIFVSKTSMNGTVEWVTLVPVASVNLVNFFSALFVDETRQRLFATADWVSSIEIPDTGMVVNSSAADNFLVMSLNTTDGSIIWATTSNSTNTTAQAYLFDVQLGCDNSTVYLTGAASGNVTVGNMTIAATSNSSALILTLNATTGHPIRQLLSQSEVIAEGDALKFDCTHGMLYVLGRYNSVSNTTTSGVLPPAVFGMARTQHSDGCFLDQFTIPNLVAQRAMSLGVAHNETCEGWQLVLAFNGTKQIVSGDFSGNLTANVVCSASGGNTTFENQGSFDGFFAIAEMPTTPVTATENSSSATWLLVRAIGTEGGDIVEDMAIDQKTQNSSQSVIFIISGSFGGNVTVAGSNLTLVGNSTTGPDAFAALYNLTNFSNCSVITGLGATSWGSDGFDDASGVAVNLNRTESADATTYVFYAGGETDGPFSVFPGGLNISTSFDAYTAVVSVGCASGTSDAPSCDVTTMM